MISLSEAFNKDGYSHASMNREPKSINSKLVIQCISDRYEVMILYAEIRRLRSILFKYDYIFNRDVTPKDIPIERFDNCDRIE